MKLSTLCKRGSMLLAVLIIASLTASDSYGQAGVILQMLKDGKIPAANQGRVVSMVCDRATAEELQYIYQQSISSAGFNEEVRGVAIEGLLKAARTRSVVPTGDLSGVSVLLQSDDAATQKMAVELAGAWKVESAADALMKLVVAKKTTADVRQQALAAAVQIAPNTARKTVDEMLAAEQPDATRFLGVSALVAIDLDEAATKGAAVLKEAKGDTSPGAMVDAFLGLTAGPAKLATAIDKNPPSKDNAKLALRHVYGVGRSDKSLVDALSKAAGIKQETKKLTSEEITALAAQVMKKGNAARGEEIFRSADMNCMKCHSVSGAGGDIGPDLSALGTTSPADYVVRSILYPKDDVKEAYIYWQIWDVKGRQFTGIIAGEEDGVITLKEADGKIVQIAKDNIDETEKSGSLMPNGLTNTLTEQEFLDLSRFVSELGKPGPFVVRSEPTIQRWRLLNETPPPLAVAEPAPDAIVDVLSDDSNWLAAYGKVAGQLPLAPWFNAKRSVLYLYGEVDATQAGDVSLKLDDAAGVTAWIDGKPFGSQVGLETGKHKVLLRVDPALRNASQLRAAIIKPAGSSAEYTIVGGP